MCTRYIYSSLYAHTLQIQSQIDVYLYIYILLYIYIYVCLCIFVYVYIYMCVCVKYICIYSVFPHFEPVDLFTVTCFKLLYLINHTYICTGFD